MWAGLGSVAPPSGPAWAPSSQVTPWALGRSLLLTLKSLSQVVEPRPQFPVAFSGDQ